jgi:hypothetical protein
MKAELVIPTKPGPRIGIPQLLALNLLEQGQEELSLWRPLDSTKVFVLAASFLSDCPVAPPSGKICVSLFFFYGFFNIGNHP